MTLRRSSPTWTQVPVESLKSSAIRPSNAKPFPGAARSTKQSASPSRQKPSSSNASAVSSCWRQ
jgi:hypothetical protein